MWNILDLNIPNLVSVSLINALCWQQRILQMWIHHFVNLFHYKVCYNFGFNKIVDEQNMIDLLTTAGFLGLIFLFPNKFKKKL